MRTLRLLMLFGAILPVAIAGCREEHPGQNARAQAAVSSDVGLLHIGKDAQATIGLATAPAARREVKNVISATGWLTARPASEVTVKAPATGFIAPREDDRARLGTLVQQGQQLADLHVFLSPQEQAQLVGAKEDADTVIAQSLASLNLAEQHLKRLEGGAPLAVAGKHLLELQEIVARSRAAEQEAREKLPFLPEEPYGKGLRLKAVPIDAPLSGRLVNVHFAPRQLVVQGDPLWTIADWSKLWLRVPVYVADLAGIVQDKPAEVIVPGSHDARQATPLNVPQATEPGKQTIELVYEIDNDSGSLRSGQAVSVSVSLPRGESSPEIVIPRSSILWDALGNSWVYLRASATTFRRVKVELGQLVKDEVVVRRGLKERDVVVVTGAESLYGEEFRWQIPVEADEDE